MQGSAPRMVASRFSPQWVNLRRVIGSVVLVASRERDSASVCDGAVFGLRTPRVVDLLVGLLAGCGGPAGEKVEGVFGAAAGFCGEDRES
jgi:hypothetical protein